MALEVLIGGARSGKSSLALRRAHAFDGPVCFVATGEARDAEMSERIARHKAERPAHWETLEAPLQLARAIAQAPADSLVIVDCLTPWLSNLVGAGASDGEVDSSSLECAQAAAERAAPVVAVTNEVGLGIVPLNELARRFRDLQGRVNAQWVAHAQRASLVVAGAALPLEVGP